MEVKIERRMAVRRERRPEFGCCRSFVLMSETIAYRLSAKNGYDLVVGNVAVLKCVQ